MDASNSSSNIECSVSNPLRPVGNPIGQSGAQCLLRTDWDTTATAQRRESWGTRQKRAPVMDMSLDILARIRTCVVHDTTVDTMVQKFVVSYDKLSDTKD